MSEPRIVPFGDAALLVVLGEAVEVALNEAVHRLAGAVRRACPAVEGWGEPVPSYASLAVPYDPLRLDLRTALGHLGDVVRGEGGTAADWQASPDPAEAGEAVPPLEVPVRYGGEEGPDLEAVARASGLTPAEVVALHAGGTYRVFVLGFSPGFGYLGPLPERLRLPRRDEIRARVPAGSVAIAGDQTGIYPTEGPGGWQLIGRTDLVLWDPARQPPALLAPGRLVRFAPVEGGRRR